MYTVLLEPPAADGEGPKQAREERHKHQIQPLELTGKLVKGTLLVVASGTIPTGGSSGSPGSVDAIITK